ncbi:Na+/H+ antiporter NhaA, partial [Thioclava sp. BHET1]
MATWVENRRSAALRQFSHVSKNATAAPLQRSAAFATAEFQMPHWHPEKFRSRMYPVSKAIDLFAIALIAGLLLALLWANVAPESYADFVELRLADDFFIGYPDPGSALPGDRTLTLGYLSGNVLMSLFFLYIGKELWEAVALPGGALNGRRAVAPLIAAAGAMLVPVALYLGLSLLISDPEIAQPALGWPVPLAGDVALSYILGRRLLGAGHPALRFLMLVAISCD